VHGVGIDSSVADMTLDEACDMLDAAVEAAIAALTCTYRSTKSRKRNLLTPPSTHNHIQQALLVPVGLAAAAADNIVVGGCDGTAKEHGSVQETVNGDVCDRLPAWYCSPNM